MSLADALLSRGFHSFGVALDGRLKIFFVERRRREKGWPVSSDVALVF